MFNFNYSGALESLPVGCFNTSNIVWNAWLGFFSNFNGNGGKLTRNTSSGVEIKNCYNGSTNYGYRNGTWTTNVSVPAWGTFQYYTAT
jgi:surface protein